MGVRKIITVLFLFLFPPFFFSATKTFTGPGNFSDATKWNGGTLPVAGDDLRINGVCTFDNAANNLVYLSLNVGFAAAGTLNWSAAGTNTLNVTAVTSSFAGSAINMTNGGTLQIRTSWVTTNQTFTPGTGTIHWNVTTANSTLPATVVTYNNLTVTAGAFITTSGVAMTVSNNVLVAGGIFRIGGFSFTCNQTVFVSGTLNDNNTGGTNTLKNLQINAGGAIDNSVNETYGITGNFTMLGGNITGAGTPRYNVTGNLMITAGTNNMGRAQVVVVGTTSISATFNANSTAGSKTLGDFIVTSTGNFNCTVTENWRINGNITINGTMGANLGVYTLAGANKTISGTTAVVFDDITCTGTYTNNLNMTLTTSLKGTGTWSQGLTGVLSLSITNANFSITTFNSSLAGNTVNYSRAGAQNVRIPSDGSYGHLTVSGSGTKSLLANTIAKGNITISSTLDPTATNFNITLGGNWTNTGAFTPRAATVTFSSVAAQSVLKAGGETFNNLVFTLAGIKTFSNSITTNANCTINAGANVDVSASNYTLTVKGNFANSGTFTARNGLVLMNGAAAQSIGGTSTTSFNNLTLTNTTGFTLLNAENLLGTLTLSNGNLNLNAKAFTMISTAASSARIAQITGTGDITGNVIVQRFAPGGFTGWALLGNPISSALTFADWNDDFVVTCPACPDGFFGGFYSIYSYDETKPGLQDAAASYIGINNITDPIVAGKGYWAYLGNGGINTTSIVIDATGTVRKNNYAIPLTRTNFGSPVNDGWNLITNPYPSPIRWSLLKGATPNIDNAIYVYNADLNAGAGGYATYVGGVSSPGVGAGGIGDTIPMSQGFYVHSTGALALNATEANKVGGNPAFLKIIPNAQAFATGPLLRLFLDQSGSNYHDETVMYLQSGATDYFDDGYDAYKLAGQDPKAPIIAFEKNDKFQINGVAPITGNYTMAVQALTGYTGTYTVSANLGSFPTGACINLYDNYTGTITNLKTSKYSVTLFDTTTVARFKLTITLNPLTVSSSVNQPTCAIANSGHIIALGTNSGPWNYYWKNNLGNIIKTNLNKNSSDTLNNLLNGNYILEINTVGMCDDNISTFNITAIGSPVSAFVCLDSVDMAIGALVNFTNTSVNAANYYWDFGDAVGTSTLASPNYNYSFAGIYNVILISTNGVCSDTTKKTIVVTDIFAGINNYVAYSSLLLKTINENEFLLQGSVKEDKLLNIKLFDAVGRLVSDYGNMNSNNINLFLDLKNFKAGIYFLNISGDNQKRVIKLPVR